MRTVRVADDRLRDPQEPVVAALVQLAERLERRIARQAFRVHTSHDYTDVEFL